MKLGDVVRDKISGFAGIATFRVDYLNGCVRWQVQPRTLHEGKPVQAMYFDEEQLEVAEGEERVTLVRRKTGGDLLSPARRQGLPRR